MKLFKWMTWGLALTSHAILLAKIFGWLAMSWLWVILLAFAVVMAYVLSLLALAVWIIKQIPEDTWNG